MKKTIREDVETHLSKESKGMIAKIVESYMREIEYRNKIGEEVSEAKLSIHYIQDSKNIILANWQMKIGIILGMIFIFS